MTNSLKMARLDYFTLKSQIAVYATLVLMAVMYSVMDSPFVTLGITASWFTALLSMNVFAIQEKNELERLYASLSLNLENIISGRYIFIFANYMLALLLSVCIGLIASVLQNGTTGFADIIPGICISLLVFTVITGIQIPIYFKLGYTKAKVWCMVPFVSVMAIIILLSLIDGFSNIITGLLNHQMIFGMICLIISFAILPASYHLSVKYYRKRR